MAFLDFLLPSKAQAPQSTIVPVSEQLGNAYATATGLMPQLTAYNNGLVNQQLNAQQGIFGPAANQLQRGSYQSILDSLNLGSSIDPALQEQLTTNYLQGNAASGLNTSNAGRMFAADQGRMFGQQLLRQRQQDALGAALQLPSSRFVPSSGFDLGSIANAQSANQAQIDNQANIARSVEMQNDNQFKQLLYKAAGGIAGGVAGYFAGNPVGGAQAGMAVGEGLGQGGGVYGYGQQQQQAGGGSPFTSVLSGLNFSNMFRPNSVQAQGIPMGSDQYNSIMAG